MYLLDTNILLWWFYSHPNLGSQTKDLIQDPENSIFVSAASVWEISIKMGKGNLAVPDNFTELLYDEGFTELNITHLHAMHVLELPLHHSDPFDRILISQALVENLTLVSTDNKFSLYTVKTFSGFL